MKRTIILLALACWGCEKPAAPPQPPGGGDTLEISGLPPDTLYQMGLRSRNEGDPDAALLFFSELEKSLSNPDDFLYLKARLRIGQLYYSMGEAPAALDHFLQTRELAKLPTPKWFFPELDSYISYCYRQMGYYEKAISRVGMLLPGIDSLAHEDQARVYRAAADAWNDSINILPAALAEGSPAFRQAVFHYEKARACYLRNPGTYRGQLATLSANLGELYRRSGQPGKAVAEIRAALGRFSGTPISNVSYSQLYINLGEALLDTGSPDAALACLDTALFFIAPGYQPGAGAPLPSPRYPNPILNRPYLFEIYSNMARASFTKLQQSGFAEQQLLVRGVQLYDSLLVLLNTVRGGYLTEEAKIELAGKSGKYLGQAFDWYSRLIAQNPQNQLQLLEKAFQIAEHGKAFALLEAARVNNYKDALPEGLREEEQTLLQSLADAEQEIVANWSDESMRRELEARKSEIFQQLALLMPRLKESAPTYFSIRYQGANLTVPEIRDRLLGPGQGLVEYHCGDSALSVFVITRQDFRMWQIPIGRDSLERLAVRRLSYLSGKISEEEYWAAGHQLYQLLLESLESDGLGRLIVIPDGPLNNLSFEDLPRNPVAKTAREQRDHSNLALYSYGLSYCFSANLLDLMTSKKPPAGLKNRVAVFAPSYHPAISQTSHPLFRWTASLGSLGQKQKEQTEGISQKVRTAIYPDSMATLDNFLQACGSDRYVQVIAHGFLDEQNPGLSCIAFAQKEAQLDEYNLLMLNDLYAMTLPQELIGFSACRTASGQYREGEGNMSLARGLAYAGVRSFTTTLWDIPTDGVAEIMPAFFKSLLSGRKPLPKDLALAEAKRAYLESATLDAALHPANWAGVVLIGATDVNAPGRSPRPEWLVLAAIATILGGRYLAGRFRKVNSPKGG